MKNMDFAISAIFEARNTVAVMNTWTDEIVFLKSEHPGVPLDVPICLSDYIRSFLESHWVHPADLPLFDILLQPEQLQEFCRKQKNGVLFNFRRLREGRISWARILVNVPSEYSEEKPKVLLSLRDLSDHEADDQDATRTVSNDIRKVVKFDFTENTFKILKSPSGENQLRTRYRPESSGIWQEEEPFVHPDDLEEFRRVIRREPILAWFRDGNVEMNLFYRRKLGSVYRWVKLIIQPASDYSASHLVFIFHIVDVHRAMAVPSSRQPQLPQDLQITPEDLKIYYDNVFNAISYFTQQYQDFYLVDLKRDRYMKYKVDQALVTGSVPYVGCYSEMVVRPLAATGQELSGFVSLEELRMLLEEKVSFSYAFTMPDGKHYRTTCTRIEMENGVPTKMLARTILESEQDRLRVKTFGSFEVYDRSGTPIVFRKKKSKQLLAYLIDKYGFPVATADIVQDVLEKEPGDRNATKYVSALYRMAEKDLEEAGYTGIIRKEWNSLRVDADKLDCDYYRLMEGDFSCLSSYHNEYMKEYSWAEETNGEILNYRVL